MDQDRARDEKPPQDDEPIGYSDPPPPPPLPPEEKDKTGYPVESGGGSPEAGKDR